jgi:hypothetical protein
MKCLADCYSNPESAAVGRCWSEADHATLVETVCDIGEPDTSPSASNEEWEEAIFAAVEAWRSDAGCETPASTSVYATAAAQAIAQLEPGTVFEQAGTLIADAGVDAQSRWLVTTASSVSTVTESWTNLDPPASCDPTSIGVAVLGEPGSERSVGVVTAFCQDCDDGCYAECPD